MPLGSSQLSGGDRQVHAQVQGQGWPLRVDGAQGGPGEGRLWVQLQCSPCPTCGWKERREAAWRGSADPKGPGTWGGGRGGNRHATWASVLRPHRSSDRAGDKQAAQRGKTVS